MKSITLAAVLFVLACSAVAEQDRSGGVLLKGCRLALAHEQPDLVGAIDAGYCYGFVNASWSAMEVDKVLFKDGKYCYAEVVHTQQLVRILVKWLEDHPAKLPEDAYGLVLEAFVDAFPCEAKPK